jgi:hypothetical protein
MGILDAATNAVSTASRTIDSFGPASALSSFTSGISGALQGVGNFLKGIGFTGLPLPNPLSAYPTYNYNFTISVLTDDDLNNPDQSYMTGKPLPVICKSGNGDPSNRIATAYGRFDFYINNVNMTSAVGFEENNNTNVSMLSFEIIEPYSMGMFMIALQTAAYQAGHPNYREAPFLLTLEFRGNTQDGIPKLIPGCTRHIPFRFTNMDMKVTEKGAVYQCQVMPWSHQAYSTKNSALKSDMSIRGATVQEMLQTGPKSLQAVINQRLQQYKKDKIVEVPDEVLILFPNEIASSSSPAQSLDNIESKVTATVSPAAMNSGGAGGGLFQKLGVAKSKVNSTLVQPEGECNALGKASMGFGLDNKGEPIPGDENKVWDPEKKVWVRGNNTQKVDEGGMKFRQDTDIINAINQVLLKSNYATETLDPAKVDKTGMVGWWRIDTQVYNISSDENLKSTGQKPKLIVYRVIPYKVHTARTMPPNTAPPGVAELKKQAVKEYNYLYTGKNSEILKFDIQYSASFSATMAADNYKRSQDVKLAANTGATDKKDTENDPLVSGSNPVPKAGVQPTTVNYNLTKTSSDKQGGGGNETEATRAARVFHDAITSGLDMMLLNMEIWGDPYYIAQSGMGNYTAKGTPFDNLNQDGTVNYQNGEVYINVNFRTPIDINQGTGLYNFAGAKSAPVIQFSGLYRVQTIQHSFRDGQFRQTLQGARLPQQENPEQGTSTKVFSTKNTEQPANNVWNKGED